MIYDADERSRFGDVQGALLVYGATGVTGRRVVHLAVTAGLHPIVAGRDVARLHKLAGPLGLEVRAADLSSQALDSILKGVRVIVSCVGPYSHFGIPILEAAIRSGAHYVDFTGEPQYVHRLIHDYDDAAKASGSVIVPSAGLGVCSGLAAGVACQGLRKVERVSVIYKLSGVRMSTGTAQSTLELLAGGAAVVRNGKVTFVRSGSNLRRLRGELAYAFPLADPLALSRVWPSALINSFLISPGALLVWLASPLMMVGGLKPVRRFLLLVEKFIRGADLEDVAGHVEVTAEVEGEGCVQSATAVVENMYELTGRAGFEVARSLMEHDWQPGVRASIQVLIDPEKSAQAIGIALIRDPDRT